MTKNKIILSLFLAFTISVVYPQALTLKKANAHFGKLEYKDAAQLYVSALSKDPNLNLAVHNLATCYLKLNDIKNAEKWYAKAVTLNDAKPNEYLEFAEILKQNSKYEESKKWFDKYSSATGNTKRSNRLYESNEELKDYYTDSASFEITLAKELSSAGSDFSPYYYKDGLLYVSERDHDKFSTSEFLWDKSHYLDLYYSEFDNKAKPSFKKESPFHSKLNTKYHEGPLAMNKEQTFMVFTRNNYFQNKVRLSNDGVNKLKLFYNELNNGKWSSAKDFPYNNDQYSCGHPALTADGKTMYFVSDMPGGIGGTDIWKSSFTNSTWTKPVNLGEKINTEGNEMFPTLIKDSVFYFASNGLGGLGGLDVFSVPYNNGSFSTPKNIGYPINSNMDDFGLIFSPENESGFFSSNRPNKDGGSDDIYSFKTKGYYLTILLIDENTKLPLSKGVVTYTLSNKTYAIVTDDMGKYKIKVRPETDYNLASLYPKYSNATSTISTKGSSAKKNLDLVIPMRPMEYKLIATVTDAKTKQFINEAEIKILDDLNNKTVFINEKTNVQGSVTKMLLGKTKGDKIKFEIILKKENYLSKTEIFEIELANEPTIQIPINLLALDPISIGTIVGKLIDIKPIYFDLDKSLIRPDAAIELDKMVTVLMENPTIVIELGSHTDCRASASYNMSLSDRRAKASAAYIISKGIDKKRVFGKGYGESKLMNKCACEGKVEVPCSEEEHQLNRRTEFKIVKM
jgi:outer membrane protein OmpA-like peptidoglycan-associated protein